MRHRQRETEEFFISTRALTPYSRALLPPRERGTLRFPFRSSLREYGLAHMRKSNIGYSNQKLILHLGFYVSGFKIRLFLEGNGQRIDVEAIRNALTLGAQFGPGSHRRKRTSVRP